MQSRWRVRIGSISADESLRLTAAPARGVSARHASLIPFPFKPAQKPPKPPPEKGAWDLTFLLAMWYNNDDYDDYYKPVSLTEREAGRGG